MSFTEELCKLLSNRNLYKQNEVSEIDQYFPTNPDAKGLICEMSFQHYHPQFFLRWLL